VAQLSRRAGDEKAGSDAYFAAVEAINATKPATAAEYVLSLSRVCYEIRGRDETIALLIKGGEWARSVEDGQLRRYALWCYSQALVGYDDLEAARKVMRNEADAAWRSDALAALATTEMRFSRAGAAGRGAGDFAPYRNAEMAAEMNSRSFTQNAASQNGKMATFNKSVDYEGTFQQQSIQQGNRPE
jgi:hypothetical protein